MIEAVVEESVSDVLFPTEFDEFFACAKEYDVEYITTLIYYTLAQSSNAVDPNRLYDEISLTYARGILEDWQDSGMAKELLRYFVFAKNTLLNDKVYSTKYAPKARAKNKSQAQSTIPSFNSKTCLLALSYTQLRFDVDDNTLFYQTLFRLWLYIHGLYNIAENEAYDKVLQHVVSRFRELTYSDGDVPFFIKFFESIGARLSSRHRSFSACNNAIYATATHLLELETDNRRNSTFLRNVIRLSLHDNAADFSIYSLSADGHSAPNTQSLKRFKKKAGIALNLDEAFEVNEARTLINIEDTEEDALEEADSLIAYGTDKNATEPERLIYSNSITYQSAEISHYVPWSWEKLLPPEIALLQNWIDKSLTSPDIQKSFAGALVWLALRYGRSLDKVLLFPISDTPTDDWTLSLDFKVLSRNPIRRQSARYPTEEMLNWVKPLGDYISTPLPKNITRALSSAASNHPDPRQLNQVWSCYEQKTLAVWFNETKPEELKRVTSFKIGNQMGQDIFDKTSNSHLARILSSEPNPGLPAACGYRTWDIEKIEKGEPLTRKITELPNTNLIGSMIVPLEASLKEAVEQYSLAVKESKTLIEYHNHLALYTVKALYAAMGCRNLVDPFDSITQFYLSDEHNTYVDRVYINDKSDELHAGRVTPLCASVVRILKNYLTHLEYLSTCLSSISPSLSVSIAETCKEGSTKLPLFFLLDTKLQWYSMNEHHLVSKEFFDWPLPPNIFRHRFSQVMTRLGLPNDVLEAYMGHGEKGVSCYSDTSPRCREEDDRYFLPLLESAFSSLEFQVISRGAELPMGNQSNITNELASKIFGEKARYERRQATIESIKEETKNKIEYFLRGRTWKQIDENEFSLLVKRITTDDGVIAAPYTIERLGVLIQILNDDDSEHINHINKRLTSLRQEKSMVTKESIAALKLLPLLNDWANKCKKTLFNNKLPKKDLSQLAATIFSIEKLVGYVDMLQALEQGCHYRIVQLKRNECFLEYSESLDPQDLSAPVERHKISYKLASWFDLTINRKNKLIQQSDSGFVKRDTFNLPELLELASLLNIQSSSFSTLLKTLCSVINQFNLIVLPGIAAGDLSGRISSTSFSLEDQLRFQTKKSYIPPEQENSDEQALSEEVEDLSVLVPVSSQWQQQEQNTLRNSAKVFGRTLYQLLKTYRPSKTKELAKQIRVLCKENTHKVSNAVLSVGYWIAPCVEKGKYQRRSKTVVPLAANTITNYFSHLMSGVAGLAYNVDILAFYEEDYIELYQRMLNYLNAKGSHTGYFGNLLISYHRWLMTQGAPGIDWSELGMSDGKRHVSSGMLSEDDYQKCLKHISTNYQDDQQAQVLSFTLLLCFRFGLRSMEALGLRRRDWCNYGDDTWILVRNNRFRSLKSDSSRRAIPLLFDLTENEHALIDKTLGQYELLPNPEKNHLLLSEVVNGSVQPLRFIYQIQSELIDVIRTVTGNQRLVLHHARHSFYNLLAITLFDLNTPLTRKISTHLDKEAIRTKVLGSNTQPTRRASMALALLMGHASPATGFKSYCRIMEEWRDQLTPTQSQRNLTLPKALHPLEWQIYKSKTLKETKQIEFNEPTLHSLTLVMRSVALGKTFDQAGAFQKLDPAHTEGLKLLFDNVIERVAFKSESGALEAGSIQRFLSYIIEDGWARMLSISQKEISDQPSRSVPLTELEQLIGKNRHILLAKDEHYELAQIFVNHFEIADDCYRIGAFQDNEHAIAKIHKFNLNGVNDNARLDSLTQSFDDGTYGSHESYAGLRLVDRTLSTLRTSYELALMFILMGYLFNVTGKDEMAMES